jgi:hypothetical protein
MGKKELIKQFHIKCPDCNAEFIQDSMNLPKHINKVKILEHYLQNWGIGGYLNE